MAGSFFAGIQHTEERAGQAARRSGIVARVHHSRVIRFTGRELPYLERLAETTEKKALAVRDIFQAGLMYEE